MKEIKSTGKGESEKSYGAKKVKRTSKEVILDITTSAIRGLSRSGRVKRIIHQIYEETRIVLRRFIENIDRETFVSTEHAKRKTVTNMDVVYALKR